MISAVDSGRNLKGYGRAEGNSIFAEDISKTVEGLLGGREDELWITIRDGEHVQLPFLKNDQDLSRS